jgi:ligand-binding sensor domain-containing protein/two-component sensor histidine kinase
MHMARVPRENEQENEPTGDFYIDRYGQGWYSDHHGVNRVDLNTRKHKHYRLRQTNFVWLKGAFVEDLDSNLWVIGRDNGLFRYDRKRDTLECVLGRDSGDPKKLNDLVMVKGTLGHDGALWIGTYTHGLLRFDPKTALYEVFPTGRTENLILSVEKGLDENGGKILWVGNTRGLGIFRPEQKRFYFFQEILPRDFEVNNIYRDPSGIVWVCTSDGILKYHPRSNAIQTVMIPKDVVGGSFEVNYFHQDERDGYHHLLYLGLSNNMILRWDRQANTFSAIAYPGDAADTRWIRQRENKLWIGTNRWDYVRPGIHIYDLVSGKFQRSPLSESANKYFSVPFFMYGHFSGNKLLIGNSDEGVHVLDERTGNEVFPWSEEQMKSLISNNNLINDMITSRDGRLYLGTYKGLYYHEPARGFILVDPKELPRGADDYAINTVMEDRRGNLWTARWGCLIKTANNNIQDVVGVDEGFNDREIKGLAEDASGNIWIGNHEGLYCYNPTSRRLIEFSMNDGLISNNTAGRVFATNDGREILIGQNGGFNLVKTEEILSQDDPPQVAINSFKVHQSELPINLGETVRLKPAQNVFSVEFVALNYRKIDDNQYAYYLEGFEEDWNYIGSKHIAYYTNLSPGKYTLHIKAGDTYGNWNAMPVQMNIEVLPAFYQTIWFKILLSAVVAGILYAFYRYRINQLLHLQQMRNRISADLHDELGSTLSAISIMGSMAKKQLSNPQTSAVLVDKIMEDVRYISGSLDDIVWNISPKNDSLAGLVARMTRYASEMFEAKQIAFKLDIPREFDDIKLSMEQRRNIYLIFKESVNNLVKYSQCSEAVVSLLVDKGLVYLTVKDNGIGFDPAAITDRNGIKNIRSRANNLNGEVDIQSAPGKGTSIRLKFPFR